MGRPACASGRADAVAGRDVVCNLATHIPLASRAALPGVWGDNDRLRRDASRNLVDGALAGGAARYVQESITFAYSDAGDAWIAPTRCSMVTSPCWINPGLSPTWVPYVYPLSLRP